MPDYQYEALPNTTNSLYPTRLVTLCPGEREDALECHIKFVQINSNGPQIEYEALSYCWGDRKDFAKLNVMGENTTGDISLHKNLYDALIGLRNPTSERTLWVDAISINQNDTHEKNVQVRAMHNIYRAASNVIIWLGTPGPQSSKWNPKKAFLTVEEYFRLSQEKPAMAPWPRGTWYRFKRNFYGIASFPGTDCIREILACPWFRRIWIIQEVSCSKKATITCDDGSRIDFGRFITALRFATTKNLFQITIHVQIQNSGKYRENVSSWTAATQMDAIRNRASSSSDRLLDYLNRFLGSQCSEPLDRIFALYGISELPHERCLATAFKDGNLRPDYGKTLDELYMAAAKTSMNSGNLDILSRPIVKSHALSRLPTWTPDWTLGSSTATLGSLAATGKYHASGSSVAVPIFTREGQCKLQGIIVSTIDSMGVPPYGFDNIRNVSLRNLLLICGQSIEWALQFAEWESMYYGSSCKYSLSDELFSDVYLSIVRATRRSYETQWFEPSLRTVEKISDQEMLDFFRRGHEVLLALASVQSEKSLRNYWKLLVKVLKHSQWGKWRGIFASGIHDDQIITERSIFASGAGHFGVCPIDAAVGDKIAILKGSRVPLILRETVSGDRNFTLIGDAYLHGIMQGEAFDENACVSITLE
ncbi:MAG: hypothetical protein Q9227_005414 [Pyrenula ochraceoflavens]